MKPTEAAAVAHYKKDVVEAITPHYEQFLPYLQWNHVISYDTRDVHEIGRVLTTDTVNKVLNVLIQNDDGWNGLIGFLISIGSRNLANLMKEREVEETLASQNGNVERPGLGNCQTSKPSALRVFSLRLADYYKRHYVTLPTMGQPHKHVKEAWVPLLIEGYPDTVKIFNHVDLLNHLQSAGSPHVALINGNPGMGKTTLAQKIACDWAVSFDFPEAQPLNLVLAVPLRCAGKATRCDQLAIDYFMSVINVDDIDRAQLIKEIKKLNSQLLVILDGLDEYGNYDEGPLKCIFAAPFQHISGCKVPIPDITFKLIITSRPYACAVAKGYNLLKCTIPPLDDDHLHEFVHLYCKSEREVAKVTAYLQTNARLFIQVPLILTFVCYLAEFVESIDSNMTSLYYSLIQHLLWREIGEGHLEEPVNIEKWQESEVVKTTCELAYTYGTGAAEFQFSKASRDKCHITNNDSFTCGFLRYRFDLVHICLMAEFPHRSLQEYFAALHCFQLMLTGQNDESVDKVNKLILSDKDSQFGRFFFGICSKEGQFSEMIDWLNPSLISASPFAPATVISQLGTSLIDCSSVANSTMGKKLFDSAGYLRDTINAAWDQHLPDQSLRLGHCSDAFKQSLHLEVLTRDPFGRNTDWFLADNKSARLVVVGSRLSDMLKKEFEQIDVLIWGSADYSPRMDWEIIFDQIKSLPPVKTLVMTTFPHTSVTINVRYDLELSSNLTCFRFGYDSDDREQLLKSVHNEKFINLTADESVQSGEDQDFTFRKLTVTVQDSSIPPPTLIFSLIRLSLL